MLLVRGRKKKAKTQISPSLRDVIRAAKRVRSWVVAKEGHDIDSIRDRIAEEMDLVIDLTAGRLRNMEVERESNGRWVKLSTGGSSHV